MLCSGEWKFSILEELDAEILYIGCGCRYGVLEGEETLVTDSRARAWEREKTIVKDTYLLKRKHFEG